MKLMVCGSRSITDYEWIISKINEVVKDDKLYNKISCIVSGGAKGVDRIGEEYAKNNNITISRYLPLWDLHGKSAGFKRNIEMIKNSDYVLIFWDGVSKGTKHDIDFCKRINKKFKLFLK